MQHGVQSTFPNAREAALPSNAPGSPATRKEDDMMLVVFILMFLFFTAVTTAGIADVIQSIRYGEEATALSVAAGTAISAACTVASLAVVLAW